jgi:hypothetical protein
MYCIVITNVNTARISNTGKSCLYTGKSYLYTGKSYTGKSYLYTGISGSPPSRSRSVKQHCCSCDFGSFHT